MSKRHKVKTHSWVGGMLKTVEHFFDSIEEAIEHSINQNQAHASYSDAHTIKVYNDNDEIVHQVSTVPPSTNSYA